MLQVKWNLFPLKQYVKGCFHGWRDQASHFALFSRRKSIKKFRYWLFLTRWTGVKASGLPAEFGQTRDSIPGLCGFNRPPNRKTLIFWHVNCSFLFRHLKNWVICLFQGQSVKDLWFLDKKIVNRLTFIIGKPGKWNLLIIGCHDEWKSESNNRGRKSCPVPHGDGWGKCCKSTAFLQVFRVINLFIHKKLSN